MKLTKKLFGHICWCRKIMRIKGVIPIWSAAGEWAANGRRWTNAALMLAQRRRRWANIKPALVQHLVFTWLVRSGINPYQAPHTAGTGRDSSIHADPASVPSGLFIDQLGILTILSEKPFCERFAMLAQCWFSAYNDGPTYIYHWINI